MSIVLSDLGHAYKDCNSHANKFQRILVYPIDMEHRMGHNEAMDITLQQVEEMKKVYNHYQACGLDPVDAVAGYFGISIEEAEQIISEYGV